MHTQQTPPPFKLGITIQKTLTTKFIPLHIQKQFPLYSQLLLKKSKTNEDYETIKSYLIDKLPLKVKTDPQLLSLFPKICKYIIIPPLHKVFRYGDITSHLYFLLEGKCISFKPKQSTVYLTEEEYLLFITKLFIYNEKYLLEKTIRDNKGLFGIYSPYNIGKLIADYFTKITKSNFEFADIETLTLDTIGQACNEELQHDNYCGYVPRMKYIYYLVKYLSYAVSIIKEEVNINTNNNLNLQDNNSYITRIVPIYMQCDTKEEDTQLTLSLRKKAQIIHYEYNSLINECDSFNEAFTILSSSSSTIISNDNTYSLLAYIPEDYFNLNIIKNSFSIGKSSGSYLIHSHPIFHKVNKRFFDRKYIGYFTMGFSDKGEFLFEEKESVFNNYVYFIKSGIYEMYYKSDKIAVIENKGVIGCDDCIDMNSLTYLVSVKANGYMNGYFKIKYEDFKNILKDNNVIEDSYKRLMKEKKEIMDAKIMNLNKKKEMIVRALMKSEHSKSMKNNCFMNYKSKTVHSNNEKKMNITKHNSKSIIDISLYKKLHNSSKNIITNHNNSNHYFHNKFPFHTELSPVSSRTDTSNGNFYINCYTQYSPTKASNSDKNISSIIPYICNEKHKTVPLHNKKLLFLQHKYNKFVHKIKNKEDASDEKSLSPSNHMNINNYSNNNSFGNSSNKIGVYQYPLISDRNNTITVFGKGRKYKKRCYKSCSQKRIKTRIVIKKYNVPNKLC
jgi:hypothetical protein